ncbi:MAG: thioesterase family protein [Patescibacteria group bacterium]|nr:thioesterase family protein [Patescibacteria group bacterium]
MKNNNFNSNTSKFSAPIIGKIGRDEKGLFYDYFVRITLEETNIEGTMSHDHYARLFGKARELFALEGIPEFTVDMGKTFLLQTCNASYEFKKNFHFGDIVITRVRILRVGNSSFELGAEFINARSKEICATGKQTIVYTDLKGTPLKIPDTLRVILLKALEGTSSTDK